MTPKNIILFLTDQWRWDTLNDSAHPARLPHLDAFRAEAMNFSHAFTSVPLCTPARASLFTGKWPHQTGTLDNVQDRSFYPHGKLHPSQRTYLERLKEAGFHVSFIGKWHLGEGTLLDRGIEDVHLSDGGAGRPDQSPDLRFAPQRLDPFYGTITHGIHLDDQRVAVALEQLEALAAANTPFCLVVSLPGPHFPHIVPEEWVRLYDDLPADYMPDNYIPQFTEKGKPLAQSAHYWPCQDTRDLTQNDWRRTAQHYWGFCSFIDDMFGRFRRRMTDLGLDDTSVLAFASDHGEMLGAHGWFDKGPFLYEEVMRIPMLMRCPDRPGGLENSGFVSFRDLFPTMMSAAGIDDLLTPEEARRSYFETNAGHVTFGYDAYQGRQFKFRGIRNARWKYVWSPHDMAELYDLRNDPGERTNLADRAEHAQIQAALHAQLFDWMQGENDPLAGGAYQLPVGSYIDGRDRTEQHDHGSAAPWAQRTPQN